jgi:hypothetical protein
MLVTRQKVLRRFWYPVIPVSQRAEGAARILRIEGEARSSGAARLQP